MEKYEIKLINDKIYMTEAYEIVKKGESALFITFVDVREPRFEYAVPLSSVVFIKEKK